jgi:16S rRNA (guanine(966)-N(2))-methyltransferase RsmD
VLDLFAGSGSLGLEAISCGAKEAVFVEGDNECIENIKKTAGIFKIEQQTKVYLKDGIKAIKDFFEHKKCFDLIFIDPPYCKGMLKKTLQALEEYDILTPFGYLVCLGYFKGDCPENSKFSLILKRKYGQTLLLIYRK